MAGTVTVTEKKHGTIKKIKWAWTSTAGGVADKQTTYAYYGRCFALVTVPSGVAPPTDLYDITITDGDSIDVLLGAGANRATATIQYVAEASLGGVAGDKLTLNVTNAGDTKQGTVYLYLR